MGILSEIYHNEWAQIFALKQVPEKPVLQRLGDYREDQ
jgi:hypothetical protein